MYDLNDGEFDLTMYIPTRGRPHKIYDFETQFYTTTTINTRAVFILSEDDPELENYLKLSYIGEDNIIVVNPTRRGFVEPLNLGYLQDRRKVYSYALGFMGDDHIPRTRGWDQAFVNKLIEMKSGFVYGNDLLQGPRIPTHIAMTAEIPLTLGFMTLPQLSHLYADNFWLDFGRSLNKISYLSDVIIEHMHPGAGKAQLDPGYEFSGSHTLDSADQKIYKHYLDDDLENDVCKVINMLRRTQHL